MVDDRALLDVLANGHARSLWMFLNAPILFRHAEEVRFTDEKRRGRSWDGFIIEAGRIPVVSGIAPGTNGEVYNINADVAAGELAQAIGAERLVMLTNVEGLYTDWPNKESLVSKIEASKLEEMLPQLDAGMIPKMESALNAVKGGVAASHVIDGRLAHSVLLELLTMGGIGTMVLPDNYERSRYPEGTVFRKDDAQ